MFLFWSIILLCIIDLFVVWGNVTYELVCLSILKQARVGGGGGGTCAECAVAYCL